MKTLIGIVISLVVVVGGFFLLSSPTDENATNSEQSSQLSFSTIETGLNDGTATLYDVRTPEEYAGGYIEGATLFSLQDMQAGSLPTVAKDSTVYVYCRSGSRSAQAATILKNAGFTDVIDLGAIQDVVDSGGKIIK